VVVVSSSAENGLSVDSLLVCVCPATFDKVRFVRHLGQLEDELLEQAQNILCRYLSLE
jgi:mRNA interferase MazF